MVGYAFHYKNKGSAIEEGREKAIILGRRSDKRRREWPEVAAAAVEEWLELLLRSKFFGVCEEHKEERKSEENIYCVDCGRSMCSHCIDRPGCPHRDHRLLQIRRYVYQDVIRVHDMQKLLDCSKVQLYTVNSAKVVHLKPRRQSKPSKGVRTCKICRRTITEPNRYCSIACKVSHVGGAATPGPAWRAPSEPFVSHLTDDLEELQSPSPQPSDAGGEDIGRWIPESPCLRVRRRKGFPRRAPLL